MAKEQIQVEACQSGLDKKYIKGTRDNLSGDIEIERKSRVWIKFSGHQRTANSIAAQVSISLSLQSLEL